MKITNKFTKNKFYKNIKIKWSKRRIKKYLRKFDNYIKAWNIQWLEKLLIENLIKTW